MEEGLLDCDRVVQIGLRAQGYTADDFNWSRRQGFRVVQAEECWHKSLEPLMAEVREKVGGGPVYLSFDIDGIDPAWAPGTGTPEIGGLTTIQAMEIIRGCHGLDLIGCDRSKSRRPTTPPVTPHCSARTCCSRCYAFCRAWYAAERVVTHLCRRRLPCDDDGMTGHAVLATVIAGPARTDEGRERNTCGRSH